MKKLVLFVCSVILLTALLPCIYVNAKESYTISKNVIDYVTQVISDEYKEWYRIDNMDVKVISEKKNSDCIDYIAHVSFDRTLLVDDPYSVPYVAGCVDALNQVKSESALEKAQLYTDKWVDELKNYYIGIPQRTTMEVLISTIYQLDESESLDAQCKVWLLNYNDERVPLDSLAPASRDTMYKSGGEAIKLIESQASAILKEGSEGNTHTRTIPDAIKHYNRLTARNYARNWSCDSASYVEHSSCHNPIYYFHDYVDCANFVSQCFKAGGLPTDSTWYIESDAWVGVSNLCSYVTSNNFFTQVGGNGTSYNGAGAFAGSIIRWVDYSHVGLIDANDTVTATFCAHTACRYSCQFDMYNNTDYLCSYNGIYYYIPNWDSVINGVIS